MSEKYLGENSTPLLINQIKENCTQKRSILPIASIGELGNTYQYTGTTSGSLVHGYFYECVSDGQDPATYSWAQVNIQPTAGTPTAATTTFDNTTSGLQATNVQDAIDEVVGDLGTAASKNFTPNVAPNNHNLVESNAVYNAITTALTSVYTPRGDLSCAELTSSLLVAANVGNIYEMSDSGTTSALFLQGAGQTIHVGDNVGIIQTGVNEYKFNLMANAFDMTDYQKKDLTSAVEGQTTVEGALGALSTNNQATQAEVNDIVNVLGAKNLLKNEVTTNSSWNGVSRTVNADGTITLNGTSTAWDFANFNYVQGQKLIPSGTYIINGGCENIALAVVADGSVIARQYGSGDTVFTITDNMVETYARFEMSTDKTFTSESSVIKPMIRLASDPDDTYVPYAPTNAKLNEEKMSYTDNGVLGAKNLAKPINNISYLGITVACDENGVLSITGTASGSGGRLDIVSDSFMLKAGTYKVVHTSNDLTKYSSMVCHKKADNTSLGYSLISNGTIDNSHAQFTLTSNTECFMGMNTYQGTNYGTGTGTKEYVMVVLVDDIDTTYQPYAMTNQQLTENKQPKTLDTPLTIGGASQTTVEDALEKLSNFYIPQKWYDTNSSSSDSNRKTVLENIFNNNAYMSAMSQGFNGMMCIRFNGISFSYITTLLNSYSIAVLEWSEELGIINRWSVTKNNDVWRATYDGSAYPDTYSTYATKTNKVWTDGKPIYRKVVNIGALPNTTLKTVAHGITNIDTITDYYGMVASTSKTALKIPYVATESLDYIAMYVSVTNIAVKTKQDMSAYSGYAVVEYTKTTN